MRIYVSLCILSLFMTRSGVAQDTIQVFAGWNNIGAMGDGSIPDVLNTVPPNIITTSFYGYLPGSGYQASDTLESGRGYWVKVNTDGVIIFSGSSVPDSCTGTLVSYDGVMYTPVKIGDQCWLGENLNAGVMIDSLQGAADNGIVEKYCYGNDTLNCSTYGGLYRWTEMMQYGGSIGSQGICPPGWHVPSNVEYETLKSTVGSDGNALKALGQGSGSGEGTNTSGFSALLAGYRWDVDGSFNALGINALFWTSGWDGGGGFYVELHAATSGISIFQTLENYGYSVRCIKD